MTRALGERMLHHHITLLIKLQQNLLAQLLRPRCIRLVFGALWARIEASGHYAKAFISYYPEAPSAF